MDDAGLVKAVRQICSRDKRYHPGAYFFVMEALDHTARALEKQAKDGAERHVTGAELLDGIRTFSLQEFGPMAMTVFESWGVTATRDFGLIVFNLIEAGKLRKTERDTVEDFDRGYDFAEAFEKPFLPKSELQTARGGRARRGRDAGKGKKKPPEAE